MIFRVWFRMIMLLVLAVVPATLLQFKLQKDSIAITYDLFDQSHVRSAIDQFLTQIKTDAKHNPEQSARYHKQFEEIVDVKRSLEEFFLMRSSIEDHLRSQTIEIIIGVLILSLFISVFIARGIVRHVQILLLEREKSTKKLRELKDLKNWQGIARILVHELRAPVTPIKLVATDLDQKFQNLSHDEFSKYICDAQKLMVEQIRSIEAMIGGFTKFGRLPDPELTEISLNDVVQDFCEIYSKEFHAGVSIRTELTTKSTLAMLDAKLMRDLMFNLCKNASEANDQNTKITLKTEVTQSGVRLIISNTGKKVPDELKDKLFEPYVSSKLGNESSNMGLGLTIARKIALDHGGDLLLMGQEDDTGVSFQLELPGLK